MGMGFDDELKLRMGRWSWAVSRGAIAIAVLFWLVLVVVLLHRHYILYPSYASFDQGIFNQLFWNGTHGNFFQSSLSSTLSTPVVHDGEIPRVEYHRLGQHFTPALLLWHPLYFLFSSPATLLVLQVTNVAIAGLILYTLARQYLEVRTASFITASYYAANAVIGPTLANFHDLSQLPLFMFSLFLALEKRCWWAFWFCAVLILMVREDTGIALFGVGVYLVLSRRHPTVGLATCILSFGYVLLLTNLIMPLFSEDISRRFMIEQFGQYVDGDEATTIDVIFGMLRNPWMLIQEFVTPVGDNFRYLLGHWLPLAFIPLISPATWTLTAFPLFKIFIRQDPIAISINLRYAMSVVPGLFYGTILWWSHHPRALKPLLQNFWVVCMCLSMLFTITSNPNRALSFMIPDSINPWIYASPAQQWQHVGVIRQFMAEIPPEASVSATTHIVPHLSSRREIVRFPDVRLRNDADEETWIEYLLLDIDQLQRYQAVFWDERQELEKILRRLDQLLERDRYGVIGYQDGVVFLQFRTEDDPDALQQWQTWRQQLDEELSETA